MKILNKIIVPLVILPLNKIIAQKKDSIPQKVVAFVTDKFPQSRDLNIEFTQLTPYKFSPESYGTELPENKVKNFQQLRANANIYFIKNRKWMLSTSVNYRFTHIESQNEIPFLSNEQNFHYHSESLSLTRFSKLFNKIAIYSATASVDGSEQHFERMRGMLTASLVLKATADTKMTVGLAVIIDPSSQVPAMPTFTYEHRFSNGWVADIILPKKVMIRKDIFQNGRFSFGTEMDMTNFYLYPDGKRYEFRQLEINSGAMYEHQLGKNLIGTFRTGLRAAPSSRVFAKNDSFKDHIFDMNSKTSFYFNVGISYNPFGKPRQK